MRKELFVTMHIRIVRGKEVATKMLINSLRRFIAKGSNIDKYSDKEIKEIEDWINNYPRKIFGYRTANQMYNEISLKWVFLGQYFLQFTVEWAMQNVRHMPIGIQDFEVIREPFYVYVDKTGFIPRLEVLGRAYLYLHYKLILKVRKELFKGPAIEKYKWARQASHSNAIKRRASRAIPLTENTQAFVE